MKKKRSLKKYLLISGITVLVLGVFAAAAAICTVLGIAYIVFSLIFYRVESIENAAPQNDFYQLSGGSDYRRIPLIYPYEALSGGTGWIVQPREGFALAADVTKVNVVDGMIIVQAEHTTNSNAQQVDMLWGVAIPAENIKKQFSTESDLKVFLASRNIKDVQLFDINDLYTKFDKDSQPLPWFPEDWKK